MNMKSTYGLKVTALLLSVTLGVALVACSPTVKRGEGLSTPIVTAQSTTSAVTTESAASATATENTTPAATTQSAESAATTAAASETGLSGAHAALADEALSLQDMLNYALEDEYLARDVYTQVMAQHGEIKPFSNIKSSEETHIALLLPLFATHGLSEPGYKRTVSDFTGSVQEAFDAGVLAEVDNIAMYERFLGEDLPDDVRSVFESLLNASEKHLNAFKRGA